MPARVESTLALPGLSPVCGKPIIARFDGGQLSSDGGILALREIETRLDIANRLAACVADPRAPERIIHSVADILRFRMLMIAARVVEWKTKVMVHLPSACPDEAILRLVLDRLPRLVI